MNFGPALLVGENSTQLLMYRMVGNFRGKSEKSLKIKFRGFKFRDSNQSRGVALLHK